MKVVVWMEVACGIVLGAIAIVITYCLFCL